MSNQKHAEAVPYTPSAKVLRERAEQAAQAYLSWRKLSEKMKQERQDQEYLANLWLAEQAKLGTESLLEQQIQQQALSSTQREISSTQTLSAVAHLTTYSPMQAMSTELYPTAHPYIYAIPSDSSSPRQSSPSETRPYGTSPLSGGLSNYGDTSSRPGMVLPWSPPTTPPTSKGVSGIWRALSNSIFFALLRLLGKGLMYFFVTKPMSYIPPSLPSDPLLLPGEPPEGLLWLSTSKLRTLGKR